MLAALVLALSACSNVLLNVTEYHNILWCSGGSAHVSILYPKHEQQHTSEAPPIVLAQCMNCCHTDPCGACDNHYVMSRWYAHYYRGWNDFETDARR